ncbi:MAG TPA: MBL fold hydrolase, partial [Eubacteriaceae bacterium]|nr:MBL fold hydrolase [Eubacteriaceae bacterium]
KLINEAMESAGFELCDEGYRRQWNPDETSRKEAIDFGKRIAKA